jgi:hypothetical protein
MLFVDGRIGPETFRLPDDATCQLAKNGNWSNSGNTVTGCALMVTVVVACGARRASTSHRLHDHHALDPKLVGSAAEALREECLPDRHCDLAVRCECAEDAIER